MKADEEQSPTKLEKTVIDNIRRIRQEKGISQMRLSIFCNTSASYIGLMETYKNIPKLATIERIAEALNVPVLELFSENERSKNALHKENEKAEAHKQKIREHIKNELLEKMSQNIDDVLKII